MREELLFPLSPSVSLMSAHWRDEQPLPKPQATSPALPQTFFARPAVQVAPDLIGCLLLKRQPQSSWSAKGFLRPLFQLGALRQAGV